MKKDIVVKIASFVDGEENHWETTGEYDFDGETHLVAYTDYTSNSITKNGLYAGKYSMLLHRVGAITCDMLFDLNHDTITQYNAFMFTDTFVIHTSEYKVNVSIDVIEIQLHYSLTNRTNAEPIDGIQKISLILGA